MKTILNKIIHNKKTLYMLSLFVLILFTLILNIAFGAFESTTIKAAANLKIKDLEYAMTINGVATTIIKANANDITRSNISIQSLNNRDTKYEIIYVVCSDSSCNEFITKPDKLTVKTSSRSNDKITDTIAGNTARSVRLILTNTDSSDYYIRVSINAGYIYNTLALDNDITEIYDEDDVIIAAYVNGSLQSDFPTTSTYTYEVKCNNNGVDADGDGTLFWNGTEWKLTIENINKGETRCNVYFYTQTIDPNLLATDSSGANVPFLATNLFPVIYDERTDLWVKAATTQVGWYNYSTFQWANAVSVNVDKTELYTNAAVGTPIPMQDIHGMWVWIPRYEYKINNPGTTTTPSEILVNFKSGTTTSATSGYRIHQTFRNGSSVYYSTAYDLGGWSDEQTGIWVGKFQQGNTHNDYFNGVAHGYSGYYFNGLVVKPGYGVVRDQTMAENRSTAFIVSWDHSFYNNILAHLEKNDEYGSVLYLYHSKYGKYMNPDFSGDDKKIYVNNAYVGTSSMLVTGRSNGTYAGGTGSVPTATGSYQYNNCPAVAANDVPCSYETRQANALKGTGASTTGNIYGIYDMSGCGYELVMGFYPDSSNSNGGFTTLPDGQYYNKYTSSAITTACNGSPCYGVGWSNETGTGGNSGNYSWYGNYMYVPITSFPYVVRGNMANTATDAEKGPFDSRSTWDNAGKTYAFRTVLSYKSA